MRKRIIECDICRAQFEKGNRLANGWRRIPAKCFEVGYTLPDEHCEMWPMYRWARMKMDICPDCWVDMVDYIERKREEMDEVL